MKNYKKELENFIEVINSVNVEGKDEIKFSIEYSRNKNTLFCNLFLTRNGEKSTLIQLNGDLGNKFSINRIGYEDKLKELFAERAFYIIKHYLNKSLPKQ